MKPNLDTTDTENGLILLAARGDHRAFTNLVNRYDQTVYNFAFKVCRNRNKAEEVLQDTFVNVYRKLNQYDGKSKFSTWLYSIVTNNCLMKNRQRKIDESSVKVEMLGNIETPVYREFQNPLDVLVSSELQEKLDKAILKLPVDYRVVFVLRDIEELTAQETADILKISVPAVKSRLHRARFFLREQLNEYMIE
jgi:RNA polymerase sigma-70 factor, ECF subfamily